MSGTNATPLDVPLAPGATPTAVPEPSSALILAFGLFAGLLVRRLGARRRACSGRVTLVG